MPRPLAPFIPDRRFVPPAMLLALLAPLALASSGGCGQVRTAYDYIRGDTPIRAAQQMEGEDPDLRWRGITYLAGRDFGKRPPYTTRYAEIARSDPNPLVRAAAIRALNRARAAEATPVFVQALDSPDELVRLEAAKALANVPDPAAVSGLLRIVTRVEEPKDVRIAAADALRHYRTLEVARALVAQLPDRDFGLAWQSRRSLRAMTGENFGYDEAAWLNYLTAENPFG